MARTPFGVSGDLQGCHGILQDTLVTRLGEQELESEEEEDLVFVWRTRQRQE